MAEYSAASSILGEGIADEAAIDSWMAAQGRALAARYAPDGRYREHTPNLGQIIKSECKRYLHLGIVVNSDIVTSDISKESAGLQSEIVRDKNNPSGLGATNDDPYNKAINFLSLAEGIRATVAHMLNYFLGQGEWTQFDPRTKAMTSAGYMKPGGICKRLDCLDGKWAFPGVGYGASIANGADRLVAHYRALGGGNTVAWDPIVRVDSIDGTLYRVSIIPDDNRNRKKLPMTHYAGPLVHETGNFNVGANAEMHRRFTHNGGGSESVAFTWTVDDQEIIQLLPLNEGAWHAGNTVCNQSRWGMELCVNADGDFGKTMSNAAKLVRFIWDYAPETDGKVGQHWNCSGKNCPMKLRAGRWDEFLKLVATSVANPTQPVPTIDPNIERFAYDKNEYAIVNQMVDGIGLVEMLEFYREMGGTPRLGLPTEGMRMETVDGKRVFVQNTENVKMEFWADGFGNLGAYYRTGRIER